MENSSKFETIARIDLHTFQIFFRLEPILNSFESGDRNMIDLQIFTLSSGDFLCVRHFIKAELRRLLISDNFFFLFFKRQSKIRQTISK